MTPPERSGLHRESTNGRALAAPIWPSEGPLEKIVLTDYKSRLDDAEIRGLSFGHCSYGHRAGSRRVTAMIYRVPVALARLTLARHPGTTTAMTTETAPLSVEAVHELASMLAFDTLPELLEWVSASPAAPVLVEQTLLELGIPEPELDTDGVPVPGSALLKLLHWSHVGQIADSLTRYTTEGGAPLAERPRLRVVQVSA